MRHTERPPPPQSAAIRGNPRHPADLLALRVESAGQLIERGEYAGILPSVGIHGLDPRQIIIRDFAPLKNCGRHLVLHWNERQMRRRGVDSGAIEEIAKALQE